MAREQAKQYRTGQREISGGNSSIALVGEPDRPRFLVTADALLNIKAGVGREVFYGRLGNDDVFETDGGTAQILSERAAAVAYGVMFASRAAIEATSLPGNDAASKLTRHIDALGKLLVRNGPDSPELELVPPAAREYAKFLYATSSFPVVHEHSEPVVPSQYTV